MPEGLYLNRYLYVMLADAFEITKKHFPTRKVLPIGYKYLMASAVAPFG
jgi:hypothetical protein